MGGGDIDGSGVAGNCCGRRLDSLFRERFLHVQILEIRF